MEFYRGIIGSWQPAFVDSESGKREQHKCDRFFRTQKVSSTDLNFSIKPYSVLRSFFNASPFYPRTKPNPTIPQGGTNRVVKASRNYSKFVSKSDIIGLVFDSGDVHQFEIFLVPRPALVRADAVHRQRTQLGVFNGDG